MILIIILKIDFVFEYVDTTTCANTCALKYHRHHHQKQHNCHRPHQQASSPPPHQHHQRPDYPCVDSCKLC